MSLLAAAALGVGLGVFTGLPLGVINVAVVEAALAARRRVALGLGLGGAIADMLQAALAFVGVGQLVIARPEITRGFGILAGALIVGYAVLVWRRRRRPTAVQQDGSVWRSLGIGVSLTLPNPGALAAWVAVAAAVWPRATPAEAVAVALGVGAGSAVWFSVLGRLVARLPREHRALKIFPRVAMAVLIGSGAIGLVRLWLGWH